VWFDGKKAAISDALNGHCLIKSIVPFSLPHAALADLQLYFVQLPAIELSKYYANKSNSVKRPIFEHF